MCQFAYAAAYGSLQSFNLPVVICINPLRGFHTVHFSPCLRFWLSALALLPPHAGACFLAWGGWGWWGIPNLDLYFRGEDRVVHNTACNTDKIDLARQTGPVFGYTHSFFSFFFFYGCSFKLISARV